LSGWSRRSRGRHEEDDHNAHRDGCKRYLAVGNPPRHLSSIPILLGHRGTRSDCHRRCKAQISSLSIGKSYCVRNQDIRRSMQDIHHDRVDKDHGREDNAHDGLDSHHDDREDMDHDGDEAVLSRIEDQIHDREDGEVAQDQISCPDQVDYVSASGIRCCAVEERARTLAVEVLEGIREVALGHVHAYILPRCGGFALPTSRPACDGSAGQYLRHCRSQVLEACHRTARHNHVREGGISCAARATFSRRVGILCLCLLLLSSLVPAHFHVLLCGASFHRRIRR
jgi:hypothetical protein